MPEDDVKKSDQQGGAELHKSDHPEGAENEVEPPKSEVAPNSNTPADQAGDFNNDDSGVSHPVTGEPMTNTQPASSMDIYFTRLDEELAGHETDIDLLNAWDDAHVETQLAGKPEALERAAKLKAKHLARIDGLNRTIAETEQGQGSLLSGLPEIPE